MQVAAGASGCALWVAPKLCAVNVEAVKGSVAESILTQEGHHFQTCVCWRVGFALRVRILKSSARAQRDSIALIDVRACKTGPCESAIACACKRTNGVRACRFDVTIVRLESALVNIRAGWNTTSSVTGRAHTHERPQRIDARGIDVAVMNLQRALVNRSTT
jgi:hypothetical protein